MWQRKCANCGVPGHPIMANKCIHCLKPFYNKEEEFDFNKIGDNWTITKEDNKVVLKYNKGDIQSTIKIFFDNNNMQMEYQTDDDLVLLIDSLLANHRLDILERLKKEEK